LGTFYNASNVYANIIDGTGTIITVNFNASNYKVIYEPGTADKNNTVNICIYTDANDVICPIYKEWVEFFVKDCPCDFTQPNPTDTAICYNTQATLTLAKAIGADGPDDITYHWQRSTGNGIWETAPGIFNEENYTTTNLSNNRYYRRQATSTKCETTITSDSALVRVSSVSQGSMMVNRSVCSGDTVHINMGQATGGIGTLTYRWMQSANNGDYEPADGDPYSYNYISPPLQPTSIKYLRYVIDSLGCEFQYNSEFVITISIEVTSANPEDTAICFGTTHTFDIGPGTGENYPSPTNPALRYFWQQSVDGINWTTAVGSPSSPLSTHTYTTPPLTDSMFYRRVVIQNSATKRCDTLYTEAALVRVLPLPAISVVKSDTAVCERNTINLTGIATTSGLAVDSVNYYEGASTIKIPDPANYTVITDTTITATAYRNGCDSTVRFRVRVKPNNTAEPLLPVALCRGTEMTHVTIVTTGATGINEDEITGLPAGVTASWENDLITISGTPTEASPPDFDFTIPLTGGCGTVNATGTIVVHPRSDAGIALKDTAICVNTGANISLTGYAGSIRWQSSTDDITYFDTGGTEDAFTTPDLTQPMWYRAIATSGVCEPDTSNHVKVTIALLTQGNPKDTAICHNTNTTINLAAVAGNNNVIYQWQESTNGTHWSNANTANGPDNQASYTTPNLTDSMYYRRQATLCGGTITSDPALVKVKPVPTLNSATNLPDICSETTFSYTATSTTAGTTYAWERVMIPGILPVSERGFVEEINETLINNTSNPITVTYEFLLTAAGCENTQAINVTVVPTVAPSITISAPLPICEGASVTFRSTITNGGSNPAYRWIVNGTMVTGATANSYTYFPSDGDEVIGMLTSNAACISLNTVYSDAITVTVADYTGAPVLLTDILAAYIGMPVDLSKAVDMNPALTYSFYENPDKTGLITGSIVIYNPPKDDYYVAVSNGICESPVSKIILKDPCPPTVPDEEGNIYKVTSLAGLCWTENLQTRLYPGTTDSIPFAKPYTCLTCPSQLDTIFGLLYTWYSAVNEPDGSTNSLSGNVQGVCPDGWRIPSQAEWSLLEQYDANMLKSKEDWLDPPGPGTDDYGFDARPAGWYNNRFEKLYGFAGWWASDVSSASTTAHYFKITYYCDKVEHDVTGKNTAMSVRCVRKWE